MIAAWMVAALVLAGLVGLVVHLADARLPTRGRRLIVNLADGSALRGILIQSRGPWLRLEDAELLRSGSGVVETLRIDGSVFIERPRIAFIQVLP